MLGERKEIEVGDLRLITETPGLRRGVSRAITVASKNRGITSAMGFEIYPDGFVVGRVTDDAIGEISVGLGNIDTMREIIKQLEEAQKPQA